MAAAKCLAWGILGTGRAAAQFARSLQSSETGRLAAVAGRSRESCQRFSPSVTAVHTYSSYEELLADARVDAVYVALPHSLHRAWTLSALRAGKVVLCEKPIGLDAQEALEMADAAHQTGRLLMEAFGYRCHPRTQRFLDLLRDGAIGVVKEVDAQFRFDADPRDRRLFDVTMGGGAILDVGCYVMNAARLIAGTIAGSYEPTFMSGDAIWRGGVEVEAHAHVTFSNCFTATLCASIVGLSCQVLRVIGTNGTIELETPFACSDGTSQLCLNGVAVGGVSTPEELRDSYATEADSFAKHIMRGKSPHVPVGDSVANMVALDRWRECLGC